MDYTQSLVSPSILSCDFSQLGNESHRLTQAGADWIHCDVMDGHFVNNISFGADFIKAISRHTLVPLDIHLMIERPDLYLERFLPHAHCISSHLEAQHDVGETLRRVRAAGCLAGLAISPDTSLDAAVPFLPKIDVLLVMTVRPGFSGQAFLSEMIEKVSRAVDLRHRENLAFHIEVDGGIQPESASLCRAAGANVFVAGTSIFTAPDMTTAIASIRG